MFKKNLFRLMIDTDRDGVPDFKDCRPFNPHLQHVRPNVQVRKRLEQLPIYVTDEPIYRMNDREFYRISPDRPGFFGVHHLTSKDAQKFAPKATREVFAMIKHYPGVLSSIEKARPRHLLYTSATVKDEYPIQTLGAERHKRCYINPPGTYDGTPQEAIDDIPKRASKYKRDLAMEELVYSQPYTSDSEREQIFKKRRSMAGVTVHEVKHMEQERTYGFRKMESLMNRLPYEKLPFEREAFRATLKHSKKYAPSTEEEVLAGFRRLTDD
jgi:hypothetical protein